MTCKGCFANQATILLDLGLQPVSNDLLLSTAELETEPTYPLIVEVCDICSFVQILPVSSKENLFKHDYVYFSSFSESWLKHSENFARRMTSYLSLSQKDLVLEIASNDGYLLKYFKDLNVSVLGVEPAASVANAAIEIGIETRIDFFGNNLAQTLLLEGVAPSLIIANNVLAHVPDIHDFLFGISHLLREDAIATFEFPHVMRLLMHNQFDTIYHEHYSYLSVTALKPIFEKVGLKIFSVEEIDTHGGSLRIFSALEQSTYSIDKSVQEVVLAESVFDPRKEQVRSTFLSAVSKVRRELTSELIDLRDRGFSVVGYGAAAKGNTLLNYCSIDSSLINSVGDLNPTKQWKFLPGSGIPIVPPDNLFEQEIDVIFVLPWNLSNEIKDQLKEKVPQGTKFLRAIPNLEYF